MSTSPVLIDGVNAYRVAEFEVSLEFLKSALQMPADSHIVSIRPGNTSYHQTLIVRVADPSLPLCLINDSPMVSPSVTQERVTWNWNIQ